MSPTPSDEWLVPSSSHSSSEGPPDTDSSSEHSASVRESSVDQSDDGDFVDGEGSGDKGRRGRRCGR